jgi:hypothetical protein
MSDLVPSTFGKTNTDLRIIGKDYILTYLNLFTRVYLARDRHENVTSLVTFTRVEIPTIRDIWWSSKAEIYPYSVVTYSKPLACSD